MKKFISLAATIALIMMGIMFFTASASSATGNHDDKCYESVVDVPEHEVEVVTTPAQDAIPGTDAVYEILYQFEHAPNGKYKVRWETDPNWNANGNPNSTGWRSTGATMNGDLITEATPGTPAVEKVSHMETVPATYKNVEVDCEPVVPPRPDKVVDVQSEHAVSCEEYSERTITTTTGWKLVDNEWIPRQPKVVVSDWANSVPTAEQLEAAGLTETCAPVVVPPVEEPPVVTPPVDDVPAVTPVVDKPDVVEPTPDPSIIETEMVNDSDTLPATGTEMNLRDTVLFSLAGLMLLGMGVAALVSRKGQTQ